MLGQITATCVGLGAAIGSGIFAAPGEIAQHCSSPWIILLVWLAAGLITLMQSLVTAELATRFPRAGGEYQYLKSAYGDLAAFFFGWSYTVFIVGGGIGTIAAALGEFAAELIGATQSWAPPGIGTAAVVLVVAVNVLGLRVGAATQNALTILKAVALAAIAMAAVAVSSRLTPAPSPPISAAHSSPFALTAFLSALLPAFWSYAGATDTAKLAEEIKDVRRALPRALILASLLLTALYCSYNYALLCGLPPSEAVGHRSVPAMLFRRQIGLSAAEVMLLISILVCLGAISSTALATIRVTYALARDGLTFRWLGRMSAGQAPVPAFIVVGGIACLFVVNRSFGQILRIYYLASAVLFGMSYFSLIVFRLRDRRAGRPFPSTAYKAPAGIVLALLLVLMEAALAVNIVWTDLDCGTHDSLWTLVLLAALALLYLLWSRLRKGRPCSPQPPIP